LGGGLEGALEILDDALRIGDRQVRPGLRIHHAQAHDLRAGDRKRQLAFVVGVGRIHQQDRVARVEQRAKQVVRQLRAAGANGDVFRAEPWDVEQVRLEPRQLLAAVQVAERRSIGAAAMKGGRIADDLRVGLPQTFRGGMVDPAAAKRDDVIRIEPHRQDVLAFGHLHNLADGRRVGDLLLHELGHRNLRSAGHDIDHFTTTEATQITQMISWPGPLLVRGGLGVAALEWATLPPRVRRDSVRWSRRKRTGKR
jgi:hypothetical protein